MDLTEDPVTPETHKRFVFLGRVSSSSDGSSRNRTRREGGHDRTIRVPERKLGKRGT